MIKSFAARFSSVWALMVFPAAQAKLIVVDDVHALPDPATVSLALPASPVAPVWTADKGSTLRASLQKWADQARWTLIWDAPDGLNQQWNYPILAPLTFTGSVEQAVAACISLYRRADKPLTVQIQRAQKLFYVSLKAY